MFGLSLVIDDMKEKMGTSKNFPLV